MSRPKHVRKAKILVFASGKGGVGKTSLSVNLALWGAHAGHNVLLIDGDLGMADAHALLGITPHANLSQLFSHEVPLKDIIIDTHYGLKFISGGSGLAEMASLSLRSLDYLNRLMEDLKNDFDWIILDAPAGIGASVMNWISASDELVLVTTPSSTALLDAYGLLKVSLEKGFGGTIRMIVNMVGSQAEGCNIFQSMNACSIKFLNQQLHYSGAVKKDLKFDRALLLKRPLILFEEKTRALDSINKIGHILFSKREESVL